MLLLLRLLTLVVPSSFPLTHHKLLLGLFDFQKILWIFFCLYDITLLHVALYPFIHLT